MCLCAWVTVEIAHESLSLCVNVCKWLCVSVSLHACVNCALLTRISVCMFWICSYIHVCVFFSVTSVIVHMTVCIFFCLCTCVCVHSYQWVYVFVCMCVFIYVFVLVSWMLCLGYETVYTGSGFKRHGHLWSLFWKCGTLGTVASLEDMDVSGIPLWVCPEHSAFWSTKCKHDLGQVPTSTNIKRKQNKNWHFEKWFKNVNF